MINYSIFIIFSILVYNWTNCYKKCKTVIFKIARTMTRLQLFKIKKEARIKTSQLMLQLIWSITRESTSTTTPVKSTSVPIQEHILNIMICIAVSIGLSVTVIDGTQPMHRNQPVKLWLPITEHRKNKCSHVMKSRRVKQTCVKRLTLPSKSN